MIGLDQLMSAISLGLAGLCFLGFLLSLCVAVWWVRRR